MGFVYQAELSLEAVETVLGVLEPRRETATSAVGASDGGPSVQHAAGAHSADCVTSTSPARPPRIRPARRASPTERLGPGASHVLAAWPRGAEKPRAPLVDGELVPNFLPRNERLTAPHSGWPIENLRW
jgi:hypothetical protein